MNKETPSPLPRRYETLDVWRGLAALWVLLCHSISAEYTHLDFSHAGFRLLTRFMAHGYLGVPLFFVISGYGISNSLTRHTRTPILFFKRRLERIYPPYWIAALAIAAEIYVIMRLGLQHNASLPSIRHFAMSMTLVHIPNIPELNPVYWTLGYEMHFYCLCFLLLCATRGNYLFLITDLVTVGVLLTRHYSFDFACWDKVLALRHYWLDFYAGILLYRMLLHIHNPKRLLYYMVWFVVLIFSNNTFPLMVRFSAYFALFLAVLHPLDRSLAGISWVKPLFWLGRISYSLYLTHVMFGPKLLGFANRHWELTNTLYLVLLLLGIAGSILVAWIFYKGCEQPWIDALDKKQHTPFLR